VKRRAEVRTVPNILIHDIENWANWILERARAKIGYLYPTGKDGKPVVGYFWARTATCSNPSCRGEIPLLRSLIVCNKPGKKFALTMDTEKENKNIGFGIASGRQIKRTDGTMQSRGNVLCPYCEQVTPVADLRRAGLSGKMGERMVAVIIEGRNGKEYRPVEDVDLSAFQKASAIEVERPGELILPEINADGAEEDISNSTGIRVHLYGMKTWGSLFNHRQLVAMQTFVNCLHDALKEMEQEKWESEYRKAAGIYLGLWVSRIAQRCSNVGLWHTSRETLEHPFGRQAIPMTWDYPEANPFSESTGGAEGGIDWMKRVILHESISILPGQIHRGDGAALPIDAETANLVVTDPPYFDAISYGDLSDYFYVWLKRGLGDLVPEVLITPLTPKSDEATALKHRHGGDEEKADRHFVTKLAAVFSESKRTMVRGGLASIMFAHQSTKAWSALINAIFAADLTVDSTWPIDTELTTALKANMSSLSSSIVVSCRPRIVGSAASFKDVRKEIQQVVQESVKRFWGYGLRGADLIVACYGPAVGVFGKYGRVEKADGTSVQVPELLELVRKAARDAIAGEFRGDNLSTLYYVWANLYGVSEQAWDDARLVVQIGGETENAMEVAKGHGIFVVDGSRCRLAMLHDREDRRGLGVDLNPPLVDAFHCSMILWKQERRPDLVTYLNERGLLEDGPFWKLAQALFEVLPRDTEDWKLTSTLLGERETLRREGMAPDGMLFRR
jgi:adenine-specific DNA methylase